MKISFTLIVQLYLWYLVFEVYEKKTSSIKWGEKYGTVGVGNAKGEPKQDRD